MQFESRFCSLSEYRDATDNATMLALFDYMDQGGDQNGQLSLNEWLETFAKVGQSKTDDEFEDDLLSMFKT